MFSTCHIDVDSSLSTGAELILRQLPEINDWNSKQSPSESWIELIRKTRDLGLETSYIITAGLKFNPENSSTFILRVNPIFFFKIKVVYKATL